MYLYGPRTKQGLCCRAVTKIIGTIKLHAYSYEICERVWKQLKPWQLVRGETKHLHIQWCLVFLMSRNFTCHSPGEPLSINYSTQQWKISVDLVEGRKLVIGWHQAARGCFPIKLSEVLLALGDTVVSVHSPTAVSDVNVTLVCM